MVNMFTVLSFPFMDSSISGGKSEVTSNKNRGTVYQHVVIIQINLFYLVFLNVN